jgi:hypothetical protein
MSFQEILNSEIQQSAPIDYNLLAKVKGNDDFFNTVNVEQDNSLTYYSFSGDVELESKPTWAVNTP